MRFKTDEYLPGSVVAFLRAAGHDVQTALEEGLGGASDSDIAAVFRKERRALVTLDVGFGDIRAYPPSEFLGLIVLRPPDHHLETLTAVFKRVIRLLATKELSGALWVVDALRVRVRR